MPFEVVKEKWTNAINEVRIGATKSEGGTRGSVVTVGGQTTLPFLTDEGVMPNAPVIAMEIFDKMPADWPDVLKESFKDAGNDAAKWAQKCVNEYKAKLLCLRLWSAHPENGNTPAQECAKTVKAVLSAVRVPLIIIGCGDDDKDNHVMASVSQAAKGEKCLLGTVVQKNYKTLTASCLADGHNIISESPIDINIAKQVNILICDMGFPATNIVMDPTVGALGYGMEYAYSIMERARCAALNGDKMLSMPFIAFIGNEAWRAKEAKAPDSEHPEWGPIAERGPIWEAATAACYIQSGADILVMRHPKAIESTQKMIDALMGG